MLHVYLYDNIFVGSEGLLCFGVVGLWSLLAVHLPQILSKATSKENKNVV